MCRQVACAKCGKPTYAGCGMHVEQVLAHVPQQERCACREKTKKDVVVEPNLLRRIFGI